MNWLNKLFGKSSNGPPREDGNKDTIIAILHNRLDALKDEKGELKRLLEVEKKDNEILNDRITEMRTERDELKKLVRHQTEADLLLISKQIEKRILVGESIKKNDGMLRAQQSLLQRQASLDGGQSPFRDEFWFSQHMAQQGARGIAR